jgi:hypothetical protein
MHIVGIMEITVIFVKHVGYKKMIFGQIFKQEMISRIS